MKKYQKPQANKIKPSATPKKDTTKAKTPYDVIKDQTNIIK